MPHLVDLSKQYAGSPVAVVSIDAGRRPRDMEGFLDEKGVAHTVLHDESNDVFDTYGVVGVPTTVVIDQAGRLMFRHVGFVEGLEEQFAREIDTLLTWGGA